MRCSSVYLLPRHAYLDLFCCSFAYSAEVRICRMQVLDLSHISGELAYAAEDADLIVMEGMVNICDILMFYLHC